MKWFALLALVACNSSKKSQQLAPAEVQQVRDLVAAAKTKADAYSTAREAGLRKAWETLDTASTAACPVQLPKLPLITGEDLQTGEAGKALDVAHWRMNVVPAAAIFGEPPPADEKMMQKIEREVATKGPRRDQFDRQSQMLSRIADDGKVPDGWAGAAEVIKLATEIGSDEYWGWELDILTSEYVAPLFNPSGFSAGHIAGKAFLWSFPECRVVCAAPVTATNQDTMVLRFDPKQQQMQQHHKLNVDLKNQAYRAAIDALKAVP